MLYFNFTHIFELKGIKRPFTYLKNLGYSPSYAGKISTSRLYEINTDRLEKLCRDLNCTPNDILDFRLNSNDNLPQDHALHTLTKKEISNEITAKINDLSIEKIQQIHDIIKNME